MTDRLKSAFVTPAALIDDDVAAMVAAMTKEAKAAKARRNRTGGSNGRELARNAAYMERRRRAHKTAAE